MDYIEGEPTCHRCWIEFDHDDPFLLLCPRHAAADEMLEALKADHDAIETLDKKIFGLEPGELYWYRNTLLDKGRAAIALADGDKD